MPLPPPTARVILRYGYDGKGKFVPEILAVDLLDVPPPIAFTEIPDSGADGAWLDVYSPDGVLVFQVSVPVPDAAPESTDEEGYLGRREPRAGYRLTAAVEVPWYGTGTRVVFRHSDGTSDMATRSLPGLASLTLEPTESTRGNEAKKLTRNAVWLEQWGHDNPRAMVLLFLAEAFTADEEAAFVAAVDTCLGVLGTLLQQVGGGLDLTRAFAPVRLMVASQAGAISAAPGKTALRAFWASADPKERLLLIDESKVAPLRSAVAGKKRSAQAVAVVNDARYGGSGGATAVTSCNPAAMAEVLLHELGHSLFALGDEYVEESRVAQMGQPVAANVSGSFTAETLKWKDLLDPKGVPLPTPDGEAQVSVGAFEGAYYAAKGRYRPSPDCKMRTPNQNFCPVCANEIVRKLSQYL